MAPRRGLSRDLRRPWPRFAGRARDRRSHRRRLRKSAPGSCRRQGRAIEAVEWDEGGRDKCVCARTVGPSFSFARFGLVTKSRRLDSSLRPTPLPVGASSTFFLLQRECRKIDKEREREERRIHQERRRFESAPSSVEAQPCKSEDYKISRVRSI